MRDIDDIGKAFLIKYPMPHNAVKGNLYNFILLLRFKEKASGKRI